MFGGGGGGGGGAHSFPRINLKQLFGDMHKMILPCIDRVVATAWSSAAKGQCPIEWSRSRVDMLSQVLPREALVTLLGAGDTWSRNCVAQLQDIMSNGSAAANKIFASSMQHVSNSNLKVRMDTAIGKLKDFALKGESMTLADVDAFRSQVLAEIETMPGYLCVGGRAGETKNKS